MSREMAHKVIVPKNVPQFLKQRDINSYLMRIRIRFLTLMRIRIRAPKMMQIYADPDLQHWGQVCVQTILDYRVPRVTLYTSTDSLFHPNTNPSQRPSTDGSKLHSNNLGN
jgi:hypothetical protein